MRIDDPDFLKRIEDRYVARSIASETSPRRARLGAADLVAFLTNPNAQLSAEQLALLRSDARLRADYARLKQTLLLTSVPSIAGRGDAAVVTRRFAVGRLEMRRSRTRRSFTISLALENRNQAPEMLVLENAGGEILRLPLPPPDAAGIISVEKDPRDAADGMAVRMLGDPAAEVSLSQALTAGERQPRQTVAGGDGAVTQLAEAPGRWPLWRVITGGGAGLKRAAAAPPTERGRRQVAGPRSSFRYAIAASIVFAVFGAGALIEVYFQPLGSGGDFGGLTMAHREAAPADLRETHAPVRPGTSVVLTSFDLANASAGASVVRAWSALHGALDSWKPIDLASPINPGATARLDFRGASCFNDIKVRFSDGDERVFSNQNVCQDAAIVVR
ncbi:MAG: hypothetical protein JO163_14135 [Methylobacteriaceae bacterium]|nr:hypothetical protein [Methylobacteriaceae bacterium]